jgi:hypothetical protein
MSIRSTERKSTAFAAKTRADIALHNRNTLDPRKHFEKSNMGFVARGQSAGWTHLVSVSDMSWLFCLRRW